MKRQIATQAKMIILIILFSITISVSNGECLAPDQIYFGGPIITMNDSALIVEAVSVKGNRVLETGRLRDIKKTADSQTQMIDLKGRALLPGFVDPHGHFNTTGTNDLFFANLNPPPISNIQKYNVDALISELKKLAEKTKEGDPVIGSGYDDTLLSEKRHPNKDDLDKVSTKHPVIITHISGHVVAGNSLALKIAGVTKDTPNPSAGRIQRDLKTGEPNGVMEGPARDLLRTPALTAKISEEQQIAGIKRACEIWAAHGFTTATDNVPSMKMVERYKKALDEGSLFIRMNYWPRVMKIEDTYQFPTTKPGTDVSNNRLMITQGQFKHQIDGSPQGYTAHFTQPYSTQRPQDDGKYRGFPYVADRDAWIDYMVQVHKDGWQFTVHGNGDQGIQDVIDAVSEAQAVSPRQDHRHGIIHCQFVRPDQLDQIKALGISPSFFIGHTFYWGDRHKDIFFGPHRAAHMSPLKGALDRGIRFTIHTDTFVTPIDGIQMVWSAVNRMSTGGQIIGPDQRIEPLPALKAITINAAWQYFEDGIKGSIERGKLADLVVLSDNPLSVGHLDPMKLMEIKVLETIVGGKTVFRGETESVVYKHFKSQKKM